jgi:hypothetical protein
MTVETFNKKFKYLFNQLIANTPITPSYYRPYVTDWWNNYVIRAFYTDNKRIGRHLLMWIRERENMGYRYDDIKAKIFEEMMTDE